MLKPELWRSHHDFDGIWGFVVCVILVFSNNMANKSTASGATWLFPCLSPSSLPFLTIPEWFLCPICKESSWRGIGFPGKRQALVCVRGCRLTRDIH